MPSDEARKVAEGVLRDLKTCDTLGMKPDSEYHIAAITTALLSAATVPDGCVRIADAASELMEVADLRGDNCLPSPPDDPKLWTARMQSAWDELDAALAARKEGAKDE